MARTLTIRVRIDGAREVLAAFRKLPDDATTALRRRSLELSRRLADEAIAAGRADTAQSAAAAKSVKAVRDRVPGVQAGGRMVVTSSGATASDLLFLSEFGMTRRTGWFGRPRYGKSLERQARPHNGAASYWLIDTVTESTEIGRAWLRAAGDIVRAFEGVDIPGGDS